MNSRRSRYWKLLVAVLLAVGFLYLAFGQLDWPKFWSTISQLSVKWLVAACAVNAAGLSIRVSRWWVLLRTTQPGLRLRPCFTPLIGCLSLNNVLPFRAGDVVRVMAFRQRLEVSSSTLLATLVVERVLDLGCLLVLATLGWSFLSHDALPAEWHRCLLALSIGLVVACVVAVVANRPARRVCKRMLRMSFMQHHAALGSLVSYADRVLTALQTVHSARLLILLVVLSLFAWIAEGGIFWCVAAALHLSAPPVAAWWAMTLATLSTLLPSTPGYVGPYHYFATLGMTGCGVPATEAAAFAFLTHAVVTVFVTLWGGYLLFCANALLRRSHRLPAVGLGRANVGVVGSTEVEPR